AHRFSQAPRKSREEEGARGDMGTAPGQSTPGTQSVPGQTPQVQTPPEQPEHPAYFQALLDRFKDELALTKWNFADGISTATVLPGRLRQICLWLRDEAA